MYLNFRLSVKVVNNILCSMDFSTKPICNSINSIIKSLSKSPGFKSLNKIYRNWDNIIDRKYLKYCYPSKININFEQKTGKLTIVSYNPATSFYLNNNRNYILAKINTYFGYNSIVSLQIREIPTIIEDNYTRKQKKELTEEQLNKINNIVGDNNLSKAIKNLIYSYYSY